MINANMIFAAAERLKEELIVDRRQLHQNPEVGPHLPATTAYVRQRLAEIGCDPIELCESGLVATITGEDTGRCLLLRADMDALEITEHTGLDFQATNGRMHACGHDMHTAMLLGAARLLLEYKAELKGTVKLVFQPDEEGFTGAKAMLAAGVLDPPAPQAGLALHVSSGTPSGLVLCGRGAFMAGCTAFRIIVKGVGCHGAMPESGVDPINIAAHIYLALQEITAREIPPKTPAALTIGRLCGGHAPNIIPGEAVIEGTLRTFDRDLSAQLLRRIEAIAQSTAAAFRGSAAVEALSSVPPLTADPALVDRMADFTTDLFGEKKVCRLDEGGMGSEDFAVYTEKLPCAYLLLGAGTKEENPLYGKPMHNERVVFNEDILPKGAAIHAYCALKWLAGQ